LWGDRHLLDLKTHEGVQIATPARFVAILAATSPRRLLALPATPSAPAANGTSDDGTSNGCPSHGDC